MKKNYPKTRKHLIQAEMLKEYEAIFDYVKSMKKMDSCILCSVFKHQVGKLQRKAELFKKRIELEVF